MNLIDVINITWSKPLQIWFHFDGQPYLTPVCVYTELQLGILAGDPATHFDLRPVGGKHQGVSKHHATLQLILDGLVLIDQGSVEGTRQNGQLIMPFQPTLLQHKDWIALGDCRWQVLFEQ